MMPWWIMIALSQLWCATGSDWWHAGMSIFWLVYGAYTAKQTISEVQDNG